MNPRLKIQELTNHCTKLYEPGQVTRGIISYFLDRVHSYGYIITIVVWLKSSIGALFAMAISCNNTPALVS